MTLESPRDRPRDDHQLETRWENEMKNLSILASIIFVACATAGTMDNSGRIAPCGGHHTDPQACGNAEFNSPLLPKVQSGMTKAEVREIMRHDAERREIAGNTETWFYMSDYQAEKMTAITFTDGKVTGMKQVPWKTD